MKAPWPLVKLGEVLRERREAPNEVDISLGNIPIVSKIGFDNGVIEFRLRKGSRTDMILVRPGDLLISGINATKGAIAIYSEENQDPVAATIHYGAYEVVKERADITYLWWFLRSPVFREILVGAVHGGIKTELKASRFLPIEIPLPPLSKQQGIVARIEDAKARITESRVLRQRALEETEGLIRSRATAIFKELRVGGLLSDVLLCKPANGWSARCDNSANGVPVLTLSAVTGFAYNPKAYKRTSEHTDISAHYWLAPGDLLITRSNTPDLVGHAAIYNGEPTPCIYPDLIMKLVVDRNTTDTHFVWFWLQSSIARDFITRNAKGTSPTMKKISQKVVMKLPFPSGTPIAEQRRIVAYLERLQTRVIAMKKWQSETAAELDALLPSILDKAFKGLL